MLCVKCRSQINEGSLLCSNCGSTQGSTATPHKVITQDDLIGVTIEDKYRIEKLLGAGGMGKVYQVTRLFIGDQVAMKVLCSEQVADLQAVERFRREAQAAARLKHQNAVTIYDF